MNFKVDILVLCLLSASVVDIVTSLHSNYNLRLVSGERNYGFVEIFISGFYQSDFYPICPGRNHENADLIASVICHDLGYLDGESIDMKNDRFSAKFWHNSFEVYTDYKHQSLIPKINAYANRNWTLVQPTGAFSYCSSSAIAVICYGEVSLYRGTKKVTKDSDLSFGMVVIRAPNSNRQNNDLPIKPQTVPISSLDNPSIRVICRELGYESDTPTVYDPSIYQLTGVDGNLKILRKKYKCAGDEEKLSACPTEDFNDNSEDVAVIKCTEAKEATGTYRINKDSMIEVMRKNTWGLTCTDERFTELMCKELGFSYYRHYTQTASIAVALDGKLQLMWIYNNNCPQSTNKLSDCTLSDFPADIIENCDVVFARCYNDEPTYDLTESPAYKELGPHFILRSKGLKHGLLITDSKGTSQAQFICNQMKYKYGRNYPVSSSVKRGPQGFSTNYWKATYNSNGLLCKEKHKKKTLVDDCYDDDWESISYSGKTPLVSYMTVCYNMVYLSGNGYYGLVSYMYNPPQMDVAYINKDSLNQLEINLICDHIGFKNGGSFYNGPITNQRKFDIYDMVCPVGTLKLENCTFTKSSSTSPAAAIECKLYGTDIPKYFLDTNGIVHIQIGIPRRVCFHNQWDSNTTQIFCNKLGYDTGSSFSRPQGEFSNPIGFASVYCNGEENDFDDCERLPIAQGATPCNNVVAVTCFHWDDIIDNIRLVNGGNRYGNVMVNKSNHERYYCPDKFTEEDAATICKHLGYTTGINIIMDPVTAPKAKWWTVKNSRCTKTTNRLEACDGQEWQFVDFRSDNGCRTKTASVYCYSKVQFEQGPYLNYGVIQDSVSHRRYSSKSFGDIEANIACREMGFPLGGRVFPPTDTTYKIDDNLIYVKCNGNEMSLLDCPQISNQVDKISVAAVVCETGDIIPRDGTVKIDYDSRVLVVIDRIWYALCTYEWMSEDKAASDICQQHSGSTSGKPIKKYMSSLLTYATCYTSGYYSQDGLSCEKTYFHAQDFCRYNAAVSCGEETLTVSSLQYPKPIEGKRTRSSTSSAIHIKASTGLRMEKHAHAHCICDINAPLAWGGGIVLSVNKSGWDSTVYCITLSSPISDPVDRYD